MAENQSPVGVGAADLFADMQLADYINIVRYRKWWIIVTAIAIAIPTVIVGLRLPNIYKAETIIMVDSQKVPDSYIPSTVNSRIEDRIGAIQQQATSATRLSKVIETMHLFPELRNRMSDGDIVKRMQESILVETVTAQTGRQSNAFRISYRGKNAVEVAQVANQLAATFIEENLKLREQQSYGTADFISNELEKTKAALEQKERELQQLKSKYIGDLPESSQYHLQALEGLRQQIRESQDRVNGAQQQKVYLQSVGGAAPTVDLDADSNSPYQVQIQRLESQLAGLRGRYGPEHPEVRKVQASLNELRAKDTEEQKRNPAAAPPKAAGQIRNPVIESQIAALDEQIKREQKNAATLQSQMNFHLSKLERVPVFEQQMTSQMRDYDTLRKYYMSLLDKKLSADTASSLESRQKGERFVILDPAQVPDKPFGPNRVLFALAGIIGGLMGGIALAVVREFSDTSVRNEHQATRIVGQGVIVRVPQIVKAGELRRAAVRAFAIVCGTIVAATALGFAAAFVAVRVL